MAGISFSSSLNYTSSSFPRRRMTKDQMIKEIEKEYEKVKPTIEIEIRFACSNDYERKSMEGLVTATVNEFIYGLADYYAGVGYDYGDMFTKVIKHGSEMKSRVRNELYGVVRNLAGLNYHVVKGC